MGRPAGLLGLGLLVASPKLRDTEHSDPGVSPGDAWALKKLLGPQFIVIHTVKGFDIVNEAEMGSVPGPGRFHMLQSN